MSFSSTPAAAASSMGQSAIVHVLLVLNDSALESQLEHLISGLSSLNPKITIINDYSEALTQLTNTNFDICVVGHGLSGSSIPDFISKVKLEEPTLPIILLVGDAPTSADFEAIHAGACDYLVKSSITSHQLELSFRHGINRRLKEKKLYWAVDAQKTIKETAVELANCNAFNQIQLFESCLERTAHLFEASAILLFSHAKVKSLWVSDAKVLALLQCNDLAKNKLEEVWDPLLCSLVGNISISSDSSQKLRDSLDQNESWKTLRGESSWCACDSVTNSGGSAILVIFSKRNHLGSDSEQVRAINELCNVFRASLVRLDSERELVESKRQYKNLVENLSEGIVLCDMEENIIQINSRLCELLNCSAESIMGRKSYEVLLPEIEYQEVLNRIKRRHQGISESYELRAMKSDGSRFWCEIRASPVYDESGVLIGTMGAISDISAKVIAIEQSMRLQRELLQSQKLHEVGEIAGGIASEVSSSIGAITGHLQLLDLPNQKPEQRKQAALSALQQCNGIQTILKKLMDLSQPSRGTPIVASPSSLVAESIKFLDSFLAPNTELEHRSLEDDLRIEIDPLQFRQILMSTILATKNPAQSSGKIIISHALRSLSDLSAELQTIADNSNGKFVNNYAVVIVEDLNSKVSAEQLRRLLLPRLGEGLQVREASIELATLSSLMLSNGGLVHISSLVEQGNRVELSFPEFTTEHTMGLNKNDTKNIEAEKSGGDPEPNDCVSANSSNDKSPEAKITGTKVLVIDDEDMLVQLMLRFLEMSGVEAHGYSNPANALEWYKSNYHDVGLVVLDLKMSGMDGRECFAKMLEINPGVRVGFLSGFIEKEVEQGLLKQGALRFFQKPLRYPELVDWVKFALQPK